MKREQPNILFIITDHQAYYGHSINGLFDLSLKHFESLGQQGASFERAYSVCPLCTPARSSMMTGVYPSFHGLLWNTEARLSTQTELKEGQRIYSDYLKDAGYRNAYIGKWHCGHAKLPRDYGLEGWSLPDYGKVYMSDAYREYAQERGFGAARARIEHSADRPEWEGKTLELHDPSPWRFMNSSGVLLGPPEAHEEPFVAHMAKEKLRDLAAEGQPFSLAVSFWGPHQAYFPSEPYASAIQPRDIPEYPSFRDDYRGKPKRHLLHKECHHRGARRWRDWSTWQEILARCYGQILQTDAAVGDLLDAVEELGIADNTLVICCADHGDSVACHGGLWDKASTFTEEVARVPMAIRWPARLKGGRRIDQPVSNMDVTATMLDAAGVSLPEGMHSQSLLSHCEASSREDTSRTIFCEHNGHGEDILQRIAVTKRYKYVAALTDGDELYDLERDPYEMENLVYDPEYRAVRNALAGELRDHLKAIGDKGARKIIQLLENPSNLDYGNPHGRGEDIGASKSDAG